MQPQICLHLHQLDELNQTSLFWRVTSRNKELSLPILLHALFAHIQKMSLIRYLLTFPLTEVASSVHVVCHTHALILPEPKLDLSLIPLNCGQTDKEKASGT